MTNSNVDNAVRAVKDAASKLGDASGMDKVTAAVKRNPKTAVAIGVGAAAAAGLAAVVLTKKPAKPKKAPAKKTA